MSALTRIKQTVRALVGDLIKTHNGATYTMSESGATTLLTLPELNSVGIVSVTKTTAGVTTTLNSSTYSLSGIH